MSQTVTTDQETERADRPVLRRTFNADAHVGDGRTVEMRIVPFDEIQTVHDGLGGRPKGEPYREQWMPGVFDKQGRAANRVLLNFEHQRGIGGVIGHGLELEQRGDGYHAAFRVHETPDGDKALSLIKEGVLTSASVEAFPQKSVVTSEGIVQRVRAHLDAVASCRQGQYTGAVVTAIREAEEPEIFLTAEMLPVSMDPGLVERCLKLGIRLPKYLAHPAQGTPAPTGTPEDDTRHTVNESSEGTEDG